MNWPMLRGDGWPALTSLRSRMDRLFEDFFDESKTPAAGTLWSPTVDVSETPEAFEVTAEVAGVKPEDLDVEVTNGVLTIRGEKRDESEESGKTWYRRESSYGRFQRAIPLPSAVDEEHVAATKRDGVLRVTLPKIEKEPAKKIAIETS